MFARVLIIDLIAAGEKLSFEVEADELVESLEDRREDVEEILGAEPEAEPEGEELFGDAAFERDYQERPELDVYDEADLDQATYAPLTAEQRLQAERKLREREKAQARERQRRGLGGNADGVQRGPAAFADEDSDMSMGGAINRNLIDSKRKRRGGYRDDESDQIERTERGDGGDPDDSGDDGDGDGDGDEPQFPLEEQRGPLREWVCEEEPRQELLRRFRKFLITYPVENPRKNLYQERIRTMCAANGESLHVSYLDLSAQEPLLAVWVADAPGELLAAFDEALEAVVLKLFPHYGAIRPDVHVRITELPLADSLRDLRENQLGALVKVAGVVTRRTSVFPQLRAVKFDCAKW